MTWTRSARRRGRPSPSPPGPATRSPSQAGPVERNRPHRHPPGRAGLEGSRSSGRVLVVHVDTVGPRPWRGHEAVRGSRVGRTRSDGRPRPLRTRAPAPETRSLTTVNPTRAGVSSLLRSRTPALTAASRPAWPRHQPGGEEASSAAPCARETDSRPASMLPDDPASKRG